MGKVSEPPPGRSGSSPRVLRNSRLGQSVRGRPPKREREILDAAIELFHARGYAQTSIEDVAGAVGILKGSLYYYIDSKEDLLLRILEDVHEGVEAIIESVAARSDLPPLGRLELYLREQVAFNARRINEIAVYHHEFSRLTGAHLAGSSTPRSIPSSPRNACSHPSSPCTRSSSRTERGPSPRSPITWSTSRSTASSERCVRAPIPAPPSGAEWSRRLRRGNLIQRQLNNLPFVS
jgi:hypothetical protein